MKVSVVFEDKSISVDGVGFIFEDDRESVFDDLVAELGHSNYWAIQWDGSSGHIEYANNDPNTTFEDESVVTPYVLLHSEEEEEYIAIAKETLLAQDPQKLARQERQRKMNRWTWLIERDASGGTPLTQEWKDWFQSLRDLPEDTENWNPSLQWNEEKENVDLIGVNWPQRPSTW